MCHSGTEYDSLLEDRLDGEEADVTERFEYLLMATSFSLIAWGFLALWFTRLIS